MKEESARQRGAGNEFDIGTDAAGLKTASKGKLLIVDDETAIRWALRKTLQRMNFEIVEAETGEQAIALVRTVRFDAVLLDIGMPGHEWHRGL